MSLKNRPHTAAIEKAQALRRAKLREIEGVRDLLWQFERLAIGFAQDRSLDMAFCEGYCAALAECPIQPNELLSRLTVSTTFQDWLLELSGCNHRLLLERSEQYPPCVDQGVDLSMQVFDKLNKAERVQFDQFENLKNQKYSIAECHFFLRGVEIAIKQSCGLSTPGLHSLDFDKLFDLERLDRCLVKLEVPRLDQTIRAKITDELLARIDENTSEIQDRLQRMSLLCGYRLATDLMREHDPDFEESVPFTTLLTNAVLL